MPRQSPSGRLTACNALLAVLGAGCAGCASRSVPASFPPSSPSSERADEAPPAAVTTALDAEPPLPEETAPLHRDHGPARHDTSESPGAAHHGGEDHGR